MLVLTRKTNETIIIAENIRVTIMAIHGGKVRLAIEAPQEIAILREELVPRPGQAPRVSSPARRGQPVPTRLEMPARNPIPDRRDLQLSTERRSCDVTPTTISRNDNCSLGN
jgi:carbon storage regulator